MSIEEDILIENFLKNKLSEQERDNVLLRMESDKNFREKINLEKQLILNLDTSDWSLSKNTNHPELTEYEDLLRDKTTLKLKNTLNKVNADYQRRQRKNSKSRLLYAGIAIIIILIGVSVFSTNKVTPHDELYGNYLKLSDLPSLVDRGDNNQIKSLVNAQKLFKNQQYNQALNIFLKNIDNVKKNKATIYLYIGVSQMELNKFDDAENTFDNLINSGLIDAPKGTWYKALLYLKQNKKGEASKLLLQIVENPNNYRASEASELLDQL